MVGRGISKKLKEVYPDAQILPLDYDPDVSFANIENRLQMLVMNMKEDKSREEIREKEKKDYLSNLLRKDGSRRRLVSNEN